MCSNVIHLPETSLTYKISGARLANRVKFTLCHRVSFSLPYSPITMDTCSPRLVKSLLRVKSAVSLLNYMAAKIPLLSENPGNC